MKRRSFLKSLAAVFAAALPLPAVAEKLRFTGVLSYKTTVTVPISTLYWVDANSKVQGLRDGTVERPFKTLQDAIDRARTGDSVYVMSGHLETNTVPIDLKPGLNIRGLGPDRPRITMEAKD